MYCDFFLMAWSEFIERGNKFLGDLLAYEVSFEMEPDAEIIVSF